MPEVTKRQARFVVELALCSERATAKAAAIRAGYSKRSARQQASELMAKPHVRRLLDAIDAAKLVHDRASERKVEEAWRRGFEQGSEAIAGVYRKLRR